MKLFIDQSGKVEDTRHDTVVAFSNGKTGSVIIHASEKRKIQSYFRHAQKPHMFIYKTFAALIFLLLKEEKMKSLDIHIDREYWGKESVVKDHLLRIIRKQKKFDFESSNISFCLVGKKHACHIIAVSVLRKKIKAGKRIMEKDVLQLFL
ncbi:MAG: hypothetical protein WC525_09765 [Candidatus Thermoplasmatota archaeon]